MTVRSVRSNNQKHQFNSTGWKSAMTEDSRLRPHMYVVGKTLETYQNKHGLTTVNEMISLVRQ